MSESTDPVLSAAIALLMERGQVDFRIEELVVATGQSVGSLYRRFGSRDGVLVAAYGAAMEEISRIETQAIVHLARASGTLDELLEGLRLLTAASVSPERNQSRWLWIEALALARHKPDLWARLQGIFRAAADGHLEAFRLMQERGWMRHDVDPYQLWLSVAGNTLGTVRDQFVHGDLDPAAWGRHTISMFAAYATVDGPSRPPAPRRRR